MAAFKTHLAGGVIVGGCSAVIGLTTFHLSYIQAISVFIMGTVGGLLPDIDSDTGKPLALIFGTVSVLLPVLLLHKLPTGKQLSPEFLVSYFVISYVVINYFICGIIKTMTAHRGILHSLPFAVLMGQVGYLLFRSSGENIATLIGISVFAGSLTHLLLDELHSLSLKYYIIPVVKSSFGTALKVKTNNFFATGALYLLVIVAGFKILEG
ncbi:MAG: membrane-bound metal-dependent hydrolase YbcI (DUF457 family) [Desulforhopalus sp.]|jgi:membrane-bound metal-dependent hydrolase YbcI (DUF457 family)